MTSAAAGRWRRRTRQAVAVGALAGLGSLPLAVVHGPVASGSAGTGLPALPLASAESGPDGTWATLAMGHLGTANNTFWQLFHQETDGGGWTLVTPPGVASNGGLVAASSASAVTVGFEPSQFLRYSPMARSTNGGQSWTAGTLAAALEMVPDALASQAAGATVGLSRRDGGTVVRSPGSLTTWTPATTLGRLTRSSAAQVCRPTALSAIAAGPAGPSTTILVGAACSRTGAVGIYTLSGDSWNPDGFSLGSINKTATALVVRLQSGPTGTAALVELRRGRSRWLVAAWQQASGGTWSISDELAVAGRVEATAGAVTGGVVVTLGGGASQRPTAEMVVPAASAGTGAAAPAASRRPAWHRLPAVPVHTAIVVDAQGTAVALSVASSSFRSYVDDDGSWVLRTSVKVPIEYGSST